MQANDDMKSTNAACVGTSREISHKEMDLYIFDEPNYFSVVIKMISNIVVITLISPIIIIFSMYIYGSYLYEIITGKNSVE